MELIEKYFPELGENKKAQLKELKDIYTFWNNQINVISRKDIAEFYERHVLHWCAPTRHFPNSRGEGRARQDFARARAG